MSGTPMWSSVDFIDMGFQGRLVGVKKVGPRMEEKGEEVASGVIGVGSEKNGLLGRVRLKVSWEARFKVSLDSSVERMGRSRSSSRVSSSWYSSSSGEDLTGWGLHQQVSGWGIQWEMVEDYNSGSFSLESLTFCYAWPGWRQA